jgi:hypothetical protein
MLVSHRKKFIYTKTVKTGGTSVEVFFEPYCMPENEWQLQHSHEEYTGPAGIIGYRGAHAQGKTWFNHMPASQIRQQIGPSTWKQYFKFCVIRNPFDKMVSAFHFFEHLKKNEAVNPLKKLFHKIAGSDSPNKAPEERFRDWIANGGFVDDRDKYMIGNEFCIDYFIRYENLEGGVRYVCEVLDIPFQKENLLKLKSGIRPTDRSLSDYYDQKTIDIVYHLYRPEIERFGYTAPPGTASLRAAG